MLRSIKVSLHHLTAKKRRMIREIIVQYRAAVNFYIDRLWNGESVSWNAISGHTRLPARYISQAYRHAKQLVRAAKKHGRGRPVFRGWPVLDGKFISILKASRIKSFDCVASLMTLARGRRMMIPFNIHRRIAYWLNKPGAMLKDGGVLRENELILWIEIPDASPKPGEALAVDIGKTNLLATSDGEFLGRGFSRICEKIRRKKPGSRAMRRARAERDNYIGRVLNRLPWSRIGVLVVENLKNLKHGKKPNRGKSFRKALAPWTYRQVLTRIRHKAQENRVLLVLVDPRNTSRECPVCGTVRKENRRGEKFLCVSCGHSAHADLVGAQNILRRYLDGSVRSQSPGCR